jgi:hypothetical protein
MRRVVVVVAVVVVAAAVAGAAAAAAMAVMWTPQSGPGSAQPIGRAQLLAESAMAWGGYCGA